MLDILHPLASVAGTVAFGVDTSAMCLVVLPLAFVDVPVAVDQSAAAPGFVLEPVAFVESVVFPDLFAPAVPQAVAELADVLDALAHVDWLPADEDGVLVLVVLEGSEAGGDGLGLLVVEGFGF